jgi:hypothetical protein
MTQVEGHTLKRMSQDCWLCGCGFAVFGAKNDRDAGIRHNQHVDEVRKALAHIKDCQKNKIQSDLDGDGAQPAQHWGSPYRKLPWER